MSSSRISIAFVGFPSFNRVLACSRVVAWEALVEAERFGVAIVPNSPRNRMITVVRTQKNLKGFIRDEPVIRLGGTTTNEDDTRCGGSKLFVDKGAWIDVSVYYIRKQAYRNRRTAQIVASLFQARSAERAEGSSQRIHLEHVRIV